MIYLQNKDLNTYTQERLLNESTKDFEEARDELEEHRISEDIIYPKFGISRDTLYKIFNTAIDEELQKITLPSLFD